VRPHVGLHVGFLREAAAAQVATVAELDLVGLVGPLVQLQISRIKYLSCKEDHGPTILVASRREDQRSTYILV
jgi:hypothetical protein